VSHRKKLSFGTFRKYVYDANGGEGVTAFVIDTGINVNHVEFEGRARWGKTIPQNDVDEDGNGHGTHCAGTIASRKYGVAKAAKLVAVKVLGSNGSGSMSDVVAGVNWAAAEAKKLAADALAELKATGKTSYKGSVANMSLGGGKSPSLDRAVNAAVDSGLHFAVAAGNDNKDACNYSPAAAEKAITVGASTIQDTPAYFSNHGPCVDVFAPGLDILSTWIGSPYATNKISGTSMASPHVAGLLAYYISIHGSATFDPILKSDMAPPVADFSSCISAFGTLFKLVQRSLPAWMTGYFPTLPEAVIETTTAPIPHFPTMTPQQLKTAVVELATEGVLSGLPVKTVNKLIFNNATDAFGFM
jgi:cerevisin